MNTGKKSGVSNRLAVHFNEITGNEIDVLECQFHINEIFIHNVIIKFVEGNP